MATGEGSAPESLVTPAEAETAYVGRLLDRAQRGDHAATAELRRVFESNPNLWNTVGDLAGQARVSWLELISQGNPVIRDAVYRRMIELHREVGGTATSPLERLLVERVVLCWAQLHYVEMVAARRTDVSMAQAESFQRRHSRTQQQYLSAIRTLACVRRLLVPVVQVNIGAQQVNVAGTGSPE